VLKPLLSSSKECWDDLPKDWEGNEDDKEERSRDNGHTSARRAASPGSYYLFLVALKLHS
jgi:hypothetical protein